MSAFVPTPGFSLKSSNSFINGATDETASSRLNQKTETSSNPKCENNTNTTMMADEKEGGRFKLPSLPSLPSFKFGKGKENASGRGATAVQPRISRPKVVSKVAAPKNMINLASIPKLPESPLPKFYNSITGQYEFQATAKGQNSTPFDRRIMGDMNPSNNRRENRNGLFRNMDPYTDDLFWCRSDWSVEDANIAITRAIKQIFGNANLFESELQELDYSISCVKKTSNMKEFIRALGLSSGYRKRFFQSTSNLRFIELNFKHFLGRAPRSQEEISKHIQIINELGYNAEINSYVDSDEYDSLYGDSRIPASNFQGGHPYNCDMNRLAIINGGFATTDTTSKTAYLPTADASRFNFYSILKGLPEAWRGENRARSDAGFIADFPNAPWNPTPKDIVVDEIAWKSKFGSWQTYWYKDTEIYKSMMKPVLSHTPAEKEEAEAVLKWGSNMAKMYVGNRQ